MKKLFSLLAGLLIFGCTPAPAAEIPVPSRPTQHYVLDQTNTLTAAEIQKIDTLAKELEIAKKVSFAVLIVPSTNGEDIAQFAFRVIDTWKPGVDGVGKGALVVLAKNDRKSRVEVSKNLEGELPDASIKMALEESRSSFKQGHFGEGVIGIIQSLSFRVGAPEVKEQAEESPDLTVIIIFMALGALAIVVWAYFFLSERRKKELTDMQRELDRQEYARDAARRHSEYQADLAQRRREGHGKEDRNDKSFEEFYQYTPAAGIAALATIGLAIKKSAETKIKPVAEKPKSEPKKREPDSTSWSSPARSSSDDDSSSSRSSSSWSSSSSSDSSSSSSFSSSSSSDSGGGGSSDSW